MPGGGKGKFAHVCKHTSEQADSIRRRQLPTFVSQRRCAGGALFGGAQRAEAVALEGIAVGLSTSVLGKQLELR